MYNGILRHKKEWNNAICYNMHRPKDYNTEWSQTERQIENITYTWNLKKWYKWTYLPKGNRLTDFKNKLRNSLVIIVGKNPPANAGDTGLIPGSRRFHVAEKLNLCPTVTEPLGSTSLSRNTGSHQSEKPAHLNREQPHCPQLAEVSTPQWGRRATK